MKHLLLIFCLAISTFFSCKPLGQYQVHAIPREQSSTPAPPDYALEQHWAALPDAADQADQLPNDTLTDRQASSPADVFFIYPTLFTDTPEGPNKWNADVNNQELNQKIDQQSIRNQASIFNGAGRVYAPRYRQAHISAYYTSDSLAAKAAFDTAYADVKQAFQYYLQHHNQGRPFILASHSQGTTHAKRLLQELVDGQPLSKQLVAAYLVGMPIRQSDFPTLTPCQTADETECYVSWRTWLWGNRPKAAPLTDSLATPMSTNPLLWTTDTVYAPYTLNKGGVLRSFKVTPEVADAQNQQGVLWIHRPKFFGSFLLNLKNWHIADYNLFYMNVRENAWQRVQSFQERQEAQQAP